MSSKGTKKSNNKEEKAKKVTISSNKFVKAIQSLADKLPEIKSTDGKIAVDTINKLYKTNRDGFTAIIKLALEVEASKLKEPDLKRLFPALDSITRVVYPNDNSYINALRDFRAPFKKNYGADSKQYKLSRDLMIFKGSNEKKQAYKESVANKNKDKKQIDSKEYYDVLEKVANSNKLTDKIIAVQMATGARLIEVLHSSEFNPTEEKGYIKQSNLVKKRADQKDITVNKPVLSLPVQKVLDLVKDIREETKHNRTNKTIAQITNNYDARVNKQVKGLFDDTSMTSHKLRAIYGVATYEKYADKSKQTTNSWLSEVLGHSPSDLTTGNSYAAYNFKGSDANNEQLNAAITELKAKGEVLENEIKKLEGNVEDVRDGMNEVADDVNTKTSIILPLKKAPRLRDGRANKLKRLRKMATELENKGLTVTHRRLKALGFGSDIVAEFMEEYNDYPNYPPPNEEAPR